MIVRKYNDYKVAHFAGGGRFGSTFSFDTISLALTTLSSHGSFREDLEEKAGSKEEEAMMFPRAQGHGNFPRDLETYGHPWAACSSRFPCADS